MSKQIKIDGVTYKIRYEYQREDGSKWIVLDVDGRFFGDFGDEVPASIRI